MAERRMLTRKVTDDDHFINLSSSAQALYLHLSMSADDDGFCNQVAVSMFRAHASMNDLEALLKNRYLLQFENGVIVIKHWRMANAIRKDRYTPTSFQEEFSQLVEKENGAYSFKDGNHLATNWQPDGNQMAPQVRLGKDRLGKGSIGKDRTGKDKKSSCVVQSDDCPPPVIELPLNDGSLYGVSQEDYNRYLDVYPAVDVMYQLKRMSLWLDDKPKRRKTRRGIKRFISDWLAKEQDKGGSANNGNSQKSSNIFYDILKEGGTDGQAGSAEDLIGF